MENAGNLLLPTELRRRRMNISTNSLVDLEVEPFDDDMLRDERSSSFFLGETGDERGALGHDVPATADRAMLK